MKRILSFAFVVLLFALPVAAQASEPVDWIPADFAAFIRVDTSNAEETLRNLNVGLFVASMLQPARAQFTGSQGFDAFFPVTSFDVEGASFTQNVLPWVDGEVIFAYRSLGAGFDVTTGDILMIFPTTDSLQAAGALNPIIERQDFLQRETYQGMNIYLGDKTAFAITPNAVLIGAPDVLRATIDTLVGSAPALTADSVYQQVQAALDEGDAISAYVAGDAAARALGVLMSGSAAADPLMAAIDQSLTTISGDRTPERLLLGGSLDGIGIRVTYDPRLSNLNASVVLHTVDAPDVSEAAFDPAVLDLIPRSAMIVQSGSNARNMATDALYSLPLLNFAGDALAAFPVASTQASQVLPTPTAEDIQTAVETFLTTIEPVVDVQSDVLAKLDGSYSLALLPRPNNPVPVLNTPFDLLLVVQTDSPESAQTVQASADKLLETFVAPLEDEQLDEQAFRTLRAPQTGEPLLRVGAVDNLVVIGTGSAAELALDARRGDNRLVSQQRWQNLSQDDIPYIYVDVNAYYNTFLPTLGGQTSRPVSQLGVQSRYLGDNLFALDVLVALAQ